MVTGAGRAGTGPGGSGGPGLRRRAEPLLLPGAPAGLAAGGAAGREGRKGAGGLRERCLRGSAPFPCSPLGGAVLGAVPGPMGASRLVSFVMSFAEYLQEIVNDPVCPVDAKEELLDECENIWKLLEECRSQTLLLGTETLLKSNAKLSLLTTRVRALSAECRQWQDRCPELISTNPDVLVKSGKQELQKVENDLEMVLSTVESKNRQLEEDLKREQQWLEEQEQVLDALNGIEEETKTQVEELSQKSLKNESFHELQNKMLKLKTFKKQLLNTLSEFLEEHFPLPKKDGIAKNKNSSEDPAELITLREIVEILINKLMDTPHEPYVTINDSFWAPYIELLLRYGVALRHPEDPNRIRLEAFHM
ncbi:centromere protein K [Caloenas nicobarica]|uniref:centromere protein K n=1 Tax=Caloenas nicobarica TaxID=187106 RepID=UPI0032B71B78